MGEWFGLQGHNYSFSFRVVSLCGMFQNSQQDKGVGGFDMFYSSKLFFCVFHYYHIFYNCVIQRLFFFPGSVYEDQVARVFQMEFGVAYREMLRECFV